MLIAESLELLALPEWRDRCQTIAHAWQRAIAPTDHIPYPAEVFHTRLTRLTADCLAALLHDVQKPETVSTRARAIGRELVDLHLVGSESLEKSLDLLDHELSDCLAGFPDGQVRLGSLLAGIAGGFMDQAQKVLLIQQEEISRAQTAALRDARESLAESNRRLSAEIAERQRVEDDLRTYADRLQSLHATHLAILSAESLSSTLDISVQRLSNLFPSLGTSVFTYNFDAGMIDILQTNQTVSPAGSQVPITMWDMVDTLQRGGIYFVKDVRTAPDGPEGIRALARFGGRSFLAIPLVYREEMIGGVSMILDDVYNFPEETLVIAREIADSVAVALQHHRLLVAAQTARARETTLREIAASITAGLELDVVLNTILDQLERVLPTSSSSIMLLEGSGLVVTATRKVLTNERLLADLIDHTPENLMTILRTGQPEVIHDTHRHPAWVILPGGESIRSWMGVPLRVKGDSIGILTLDRSEPHSYTEADMELALAFANQAAITIENARLFGAVQSHAGDLEARVREQTRELRALYGITAAAVEELELDEILRRALEQALTAFDCSAGCIYLAAGESEQLEPAIRLALGDEVIVQAIQQITVDDLLAMQASLAEKPLILTDPLPFGGMLSGVAQSCVVAPMRAQGRSLGIISLVDRQRDRFTSESLSLLTAVADQIASAIENIRLRHKAREAAILAERDRLARDLHDAVTQSLYSLSLFAEAARESAMGNDPAKVQRHIGSVMRMAQQALGELRLMLFELRSETAARKGLADALADRLRTVEARIGVRTNLDAKLLGPLPIALEEAFYRIGLEALNNALRHGHAQEVEVKLFQESQQIVLIVTDNGSGFVIDDVADSGGMGLKSMEQRIRQVEGLVLVESMPGSGTRVEARAPFPRKS